jgi:hypothetical protein
MPGEALQQIRLAGVREAVDQLARDPPDPRLEVAHAPWREGLRDELAELVVPRRVERLDHRQQPLADVGALGSLGSLAAAHVLEAARAQKPACSGDGPERSRTR